MPDRIDPIVRSDDGRWLIFERPARVIEARSVHDVRPTLTAVETLTREDGLHAVGFLSYEAGSAFGLSTRLLEETDPPLAWFALFEPAHVRAVDALEPSGSYSLGPLVPTLGRAAFGDAFDAIKTHLIDGDTYQVNFTFRLRAAFHGDARGLFTDLAGAQQGLYAALIETGRHVICSASPELFFSRAGSQLTARPMKGTAPRGRTLAEDRLQRDGLTSSPKQRAENVMIVDMVRNDLGRIAEVGSVRVPQLFAAERYPNVWQMTSLVTARSEASLEELFAAVHPSASITGAPKARTMEIISALEREPRGVYTGAVGHVRPDGSARFNVAIRTAVVDPVRAQVEFGVGSGIVWDSDPEAEYEECLLKASVLGRRHRAFELLETTRWDEREGFLLLDRHLVRLRESAEYFGVEYSEDRVRAALDRAVSAAKGPLRVRLLLASDGSARVEQTPLVAWRGGPMRVTLAANPVDPGDPFLFHKTTNRAVYESARRDGFDDVVLWNPSNEVTESTTANVLVELTPGDVVTPPVECGLLPGTYRADLLDQRLAREALVSIEALRSARKIWLINSVHGRREAVLM